MAYFLAYRSDCACTLVPSQSLITVACAICQPARAAEPDDPVRKMLPEWLEAKVKEVEVALRLYVPKKSDWQKSRKETQVHLRNIVQPWKITEAQLRKIGDQDLEAEKEWAGLNRDGGSFGEGPKRCLSLRFCCHSVKD